MNHGSWLGTVPNWPESVFFKMPPYVGNPGAITKAYAKGYDFSTTPDLGPAWVVVVGIQSYYPSRGYGGGGGGSSAILTPMDAEHDDLETLICLSYRSTKTRSPT